MEKNLLFVSDIVSAVEKISPDFGTIGITDEDIKTAQLEAIAEVQSKGGNVFIKTANRLTDLILLNPEIKTRRTQIAMSLIQTMKNKTISDSKQRFQTIKKGANKHKSQFPIANIINSLPQDLSGKITKGDIRKAFEKALTAFPKDLLKVLVRTAALLTEIIEPAENGDHERRKQIGITLFEGFDQKVLHHMVTECIKHN